MADHDFMPGDLVRLKSGGPVMAYEGDSQFSGPICVWFDRLTMQRQSLSAAALEKSEADGTHS